MKRATIVLALAAVVSWWGYFLFSSTNDIECKAKVTDVDDSRLIVRGLACLGVQQCTLEILNGPHKGITISAVNQLSGSREFDQRYKRGDTVLTAIMQKDGKARHAKVLTLDRRNWTFILLGTFSAALILYARIIGIKALLSFVGSLVIIFYFLIPHLLRGDNPLLYTVLTIVILSALIIFSVAGFNRKGLSAFCGTIFGLFATILLTFFIGSKLELSGMTMPFSQALMFSTGSQLNLLDIFYATIILGASGAAMDIAMDVAASMEEVKINSPEITRKALYQSGLNVGRSVIGTMSTTLLLAYSGGYLTLLMLFLARQTTFSQMLSMKIVSAEIMKTVIGSIGLIMVAPLTAALSAWLYTHKSAFEEKQTELLTQDELAATSD